jgi:putative transposase
VVDVLGLFLVVRVHAAGMQDRDGAKPVLRALVARFPGLRLIWADGGYAGKLVAWVATVLQRTLVMGIFAYLPEKVYSSSDSHS